ncbi:UNVERIFIED_CONTAM: protein DETOXIFICATION 21 [Sesamum latifolium]|uniref:Protein DETOXIFICATION 21 n=1 Tax=Sesamum latifolium TaxID=2727402 RepID=A0AAW2XGN1_9LAMI
MQNMDENQGSKEEDLKGKIWEENKKTWVAGPAIFTRFDVCPILKALGQDEVIAKVAGNIALCVFVIIPRFPVLASNSEVQIRSERHFDINNFGILGSKRGAINIRHIWRMSRNMERFHNLSLQRSLAGCQAFFIVWCYDLVWPTPPEMSFHEFIDLASFDTHIVNHYMQCYEFFSLELWYNAILILLTGNLKNAEVELDALSICLNINGWEMMISFGFMAAASVRVSNELGKGDSKAAKFSIVNIVLTSFFHWIRAVCVAVGAGRQSAVVYVNLGSYYLIGIPTGVLLGYVIKLQVEGVWIGMLIGTCIQTIILMILTKRTDWEKQVSVARTRVNKWFVETEPTHNSAAASSQILNSISKECYMFLIFPAKVSYTSLVYVKCDMDYDVDS